MNCKRIRPWLADYSAQLLPENRQAEVAAHLQHCSACRQELARWQRLDGLVRGEPGPDGETLLRVVMAQVRREPLPRLPRWLRLLDAGAAPLTVTFLTGGLLFAFWQRLAGLLPAAATTGDLSPLLPALSLAVVAGGVTAAAGWYVSQLVSEGA